MQSSHIGALNLARASMSACPVSECSHRHAGIKFDGVIASEVIEHVEDPQHFAQTLSGLTREGGLTIVSTLNRTPQSFLVAILGAERISGIIPAGTHDWNKFLTPGVGKAFTVVCAGALVASHAVLLGCLPACRATGLTDAAHQPTACCLAGLQSVAGSPASRVCLAANTHVTELSMCKACMIVVSFQDGERQGTSRPCVRC